APICDDADVDLLSHFRAIWHRRWYIVSGAVAAGLVVFVIASLVRPSYQADATLFIVPANSAGSSDPTELRRLTIAFLDKTDDRQVLSDAAPLTPGQPTPQQLHQRFTASSPADGELHVKGTADNAADAATLTNVVSDALSRAADRLANDTRTRELAPLTAELADLTQEIAALPPGDRRLGPLVTQRNATVQARLASLAAPRNRLDVVHRAQSREASRSPRRALDALLAFVLGLIVGCETAALLARRRDGLEGRDPVAALESWTSLPVFRLPIGDVGADESAALLLYLGADGISTVLAAPLNPGERSAQGIARMLSTAATLTGGATWVDLADHRDAPAPPNSDVRVIRLSPDAHHAANGPVRLVESLPPDSGWVFVSASTWEATALLQVAADVPTSCLLVVDAREARRPEFIEAVRVLSYAGAAPAAVAVVVAPSTHPRLRGRRRHTSAAPEAVDVGTQARLPA
ncbi:MAG: hypothetical protein QOE84_3046, partial [Actinomycetota bacterium]|nr:hypothetical protein [Actinomycetota bacterium]